MSVLKGRVAIVTGSALNIGRSLAVQLASDGCDVVVHARSNQAGIDETCRLVDAAGARAVGHLCDLTTEAGAASLTKAALDAFGRIDILINNAALRRNTPLAEMTLAEWNEVMATNITSVFLMCRAAVPHMQANSWGRVINIGGVAGHRGVVGRVHVAAAKSGLVGFSKAIATEFGADGVTCNVVVPGMVDSQRGAAAGSKPHHPLGHGNLAGRDGSVDEVAYAIRMLCHPDAGFVTGQTIHVSGGGYLP